MDNLGQTPAPARLDRLATMHTKKQEDAAGARRAGRASGVALARVEASAVMAEAVGADAIIVNELGGHVSQLNRTKPGTYYLGSPAGGLGWALGAALGVKIAQPDALVVCAVGDGSYMFGNPTPAHYVAKAHDLPVLFVVFDNGRWYAVDRATEDLYPGGEAIKQNLNVFSGFADPPDYTLVAAASGAYTATATDPVGAKAAIIEAVRVVREEKRQALVPAYLPGVTRR